MERSGTGESPRQGGARPAGQMAPGDERLPADERREADVAAGPREPYAEPERGNGAGVAALVVGVLAILVLVLSLGSLFFIALPLGILALILGIVGKRKADRGAAGGYGAPRVKHRGKARAGFWLGLVTTILSTLALIAVIALLSDEGFQRDIRDLIRQQQQEVPRPVPEPSS